MFCIYVNKACHADQNGRTVYRRVLSLTSPTFGLWVWFPPGAWIFVCISLLPSLSSVGEGIVTGQSYAKGVLVNV
jgi:hypothetical protein